MIEAVCVDPQKLDLIWKNCRHFIESAHARYNRKYDPFELTERAVHDGSALLWVAWDGERILGAAITELRVAPEGLLCAIRAAGGVNMKKWLPCLSRIEAFAKAEGCKLIRIEGRIGWIRLLPDYVLNRAQPRWTLEKKL